MGLEAIHPGPDPSAGPGHEKYPYPLRGVSTGRLAQVWSTDVTYVGLPGGCTHLAAGASEFGPARIRSRTTWRR